MTILDNNLLRSHGMNARHACISYCYMVYHPFFFCTTDDMYTRIFIHIGIRHRDHISLFQQLVVRMSIYRFFIRQFAHFCCMLKYGLWLVLYTQILSILDTEWNNIASNLKTNIHPRLYFYIKSNSSKVSERIGSYHMQVIMDHTTYIRITNDNNSLWR